MTETETKEFVYNNKVKENTIIYPDQDADKTSIDDILDNASSLIYYNQEKIVEVYVRNILVNTTEIKNDTKFIYTIKLDKKCTAAVPDLVSGITINAPYKSDITKISLVSNETNNVLWSSDKVIKTGCFCHENAKFYILPMQVAIPIPITEFYFLVESSNIINFLTINANFFYFGLKFRHNFISGKTIVIHFRQKLMGGSILMSEFIITDKTNVYVIENKKIISQMEYEDGKENWNKLVDDYNDYEEIFPCILKLKN